MRPFFSSKFDITKHKRYKDLSDFDKKNAFDVEKYMKRRLEVGEDEEFILFVMDSPEDDESAADVEEGT